MIKRIFFWVVTITLFTALSIGILITAQGYRVNWVKFTLSATSLVWVKGNEKNIDVFLDNKKVAKKLPVKINYVPEGWREVKIKKVGYYDWRKSFFAEDGQAYELRNIILFKKDDNPQVITDFKLIASLKNIVSPMNISIENGEMRANDELITRFFIDPVSYQWYNDYQHIIFQVDKNIRVIDLDGNNDNILIDLKSDSVSKFKLMDSGRSLLYSDGGVVKKAWIR